MQLCAGGALRVRFDDQSTINLARSHSDRASGPWEKVIPTVPFELIFSVLVGLVFAACARQQFTGGSAPWGRELAAVMSFEAIVLWPVALYYYLVYPDWSWMYFVDARRLPSGISILVLLSYVATLLGGYLGGWALLRAGKQRILLGVLAGLTLALAIFVIVCRVRLFSSGSFADFQAARPAVLDGKLSWALVVTALGMAISIVVVGWALWEQGKRPRAS
jgi:hypothetical protein